MPDRALFREIFFQSVSNKERIFGSVFSLFVSSLVFFSLSLSRLTLDFFLSGRMISDGDFFPLFVKKII